MPETLYTLAVVAHPEDDSTLTFLTPLHPTLEETLAGAFAATNAGSGQEDAWFEASGMRSTQPGDYIGLAYGSLDLLFRVEPTGWSIAHVGLAPTI